MSTPFSAKDVLLQTGGQLLAGSEEVVAAGAASDHRNVRAGQLFVAIPGQRVDGHAFVPQAFGRGATMALVSQRTLPLTLPAGTAIVWVPDTVVALGRLAAWQRRRHRVRVIGVTGSVGKTSTKDMIHGVLGMKYTVLANRASLNSEVGLPLTLLDLGPEHEVAVLEMAMRGPGQIRHLARLAQPDIGVLTRIAESHLALLGSREAIALAKGELLEELPTDGTAVLNASDPYQRPLAERTRAAVIWYGDGAGATIRAGRVEHRGVAGTRFELHLPEGRAVAQLPLPGAHLLENALAAASVGWCLGLDAEQIAEGLARHTPSAMRSQIIEVGGRIVLLDAWNASPTSCRAALEVLSGLGSGERFALLGDILELGPLEQEGHREVGAAAAKVGVAALWTIGERARWMGEGALAAGLPAARWTHFPSLDAAAMAASGRLQPGDALLIKGSRGMQMERAMDTLRRAWEGAGA